MQVCYELLCRARPPIDCRGLTPTFGHMPNTSDSTRSCPRISNTAGSMAACEFGIHSVAVESRRPCRPLNSLTGRGKANYREEIGPQRLKPTPETSQLSQC